MGPARTGSAESPQPADTGGKSRFKGLAAVAGLLIAAVIWLGMGVEAEKPDTNPEPHNATDQANVVENNTAGQTNVVQDNVVDQNRVVQNNASIAPTKSATAVPNINGTWQGRDGTIYFVEQYDDGTFGVESPGYASGWGRFFTNMPGKFEVEMFGIGRGEFAVSTTGDRAMGWIVVDGQQEFDTLTRVE